VSAAPIAFLIVAGTLLIAVPRRSAVVLLLLSVLYTTRAPVVELGPASLSVLRIMVLVGFVRILLRGERVAGGLNALDILILVWATLLIGTSFFHTSDALTFRLGLVLGECGMYFLCRVFIQDAHDVRQLFKVLCLALVPLAILMLLEKYTATNYFSFMGYPIEVDGRQGYVRAKGSFAHPILAGVVGATCLPMALCLWRTNRTRALIGIGATTAIIVASTSSGPVVMAAGTCVVLLLWNLRERLRWFRWSAFAMLIALQVVMNDPVYFLMARIDIAGGSTGWFRAQLIRSSLEHLSEWWAVGTDYTRHWMPSGIAANENHTDMTNYLLAMGVRGGLPLLLAFVLMLRTGFRTVGDAFREDAGPKRSLRHQFLAWTLGAMLFGQVLNFFAISLYDQSASFLYLLFAMIVGVRSPSRVSSAEGVTRAGQQWPRPGAILYKPISASHGLPISASHGFPRPNSRV
jgi:hypothetical protein